MTFSLLVCRVVEWPQACHGSLDSNVNHVVSSWRMGKRAVNDGRHKTVGNVLKRPSHRGPVQVLIQSIWPIGNEQTSIVAQRIFAIYIANNDLP